MNCPVCNKNLASTLSICPSCGAMMEDSVREELKDKISPIKKINKPEIGGNYAVSNKPNPTNVPKPQVSANRLQAPVVIKTNTTEISPKPTSPTLVEFQNKNAALPDWRLQLQNAVRKRREMTQPETSLEPSSPVSVQRVLPTNGSAALKAEYIEETALAVKEESKIAGALRRIEESRKRFLLEEVETPLPPKVETAPTATKNYPFYIATKNAEIMPKPAEIKTSVNFAVPPKIEDLPIIEKKPYDTNKLKPLPNSAIISASLEKLADKEKVEENSEIFENKAPVIPISRMVEDFDEEDETEVAEFEETEEVEDLAPLSTRFNAALFDLIIGTFISLILLSPLIISGGNWLSLMGFSAVLVTCAIVMFIYLTTAIGFFGQTLGMKLFSLEIIDIEEEEYPTLHQAAVSSSVYLISLALGGVGFVPALFNEERRAAHDLLSGTIIVREEV